MAMTALLMALAPAALLASACCADVPAGSPPGGVRLTSSDQRLVELFEWARSAALSYVRDDADPVGPWYEAALPGRAAFCIRDVAHQCIGGEVLGLSRHNRNMLGKFVAAISASRDYCSFWEIDKRNLPAPVDYTSDDDFWYVLNANFDIIDACYRLYQWTGDAGYVNDPVFDRFFRLTLKEYAGHWQLQPDQVMGRPPMMHLKPSATRFRQSRGIPSYDEQQGDLVVGSDLIAMVGNAYRTYGRILALRGEGAKSRRFQSRAAAYTRLLETHWWDSRSQQYFAFRTADGQFRTGGVSGNEFMLWHHAISDPARISSSLHAIGNPQVEVLSYLPMLYYRYGFDREAYDRLRKLHADPRRAYPEASYGAVEAVTRGMMGVEAAASDNRIATCPHLPDGTEWVELAGVPTFAGPVTVRHEALTTTSFSNHGARAVTWRAIFPGAHRQVQVGARMRAARSLPDAMGHPRSYVDVKVAAGATARAWAP